VRSVVVAREYSKDIIEHAAEHDQKTGQYLFNSLPVEVRMQLAGLSWDPFERDMNQYQVEQWLKDHIIFNADGRIVGLYSGSMKLWEDAHA